MARDIRESLTIVGLLAALFCVFFWTGFYVGQSTATTAVQAPALEQPVRVNLAGN